MGPFEAEIWVLARTSKCPELAPGFVESAEDWNHRRGVKWCSWLEVIHRYAFVALISLWRLDLSANHRQQAVPAAAEDGRDWVPALGVYHDRESATGDHRDWVPTSGSERG